MTVGSIVVSSARLVTPVPRRRAAPAWIEARPGDLALVGPGGDIRQVSETIRTDRGPDGVLRVTLQRPDVRNAMSREMVEALFVALREAERTPGTRLLVLRGAGGHFCSGGDIQDMARARAAERSDDPVEGDPVRTLNALFGRIALAYAQTSLPVVAVVEGAVMGGGFGLACTADLVIASTTVDFRLPETSLGVVPAQVAPFLIDRLGYATAKRLALTGARLDAQAAARVGLVDEVADPDALDATVAAAIDRILACAPGATTATKHLFQQLHARGPVDHGAIDEAAAVFAEAARGPEAADGMAAFLAKEQPPWVPGRAD